MKNEELIKQEEKIKDIKDKLKKEKQKLKQMNNRNKKSKLFYYDIFVVFLFTFIFFCVNIR